MSITSKHVPACMSAAILGAMLGLPCGCGDDGGVGAVPLEPTVPPSVTGGPSDRAAAVGETATFSVTVTGSAKIRYQWREDGVDIPGATGSSYTTLPLTSGDDGALFTCVVSSEYGSVESDAAAVVMSVPTITAQPANTTVLERDTASFSVTAAGSGTLTYQWRKDVVDVTGATAAGYTTPATVLGDDGAQFACIVSNVAGDVTSAAATLTVNMAPPLITAHPADQTVTEGDTATFSVTVTGSGTLTYQWRRDGADVPGAASSVYTTPPTVLADEGARFSCAVTNAAGTSVSDAATLWVHGPPGTLAWVKGMGSFESWEHGHDVAVLSDGAAIVAGRFENSVTFGAGESSETPLTSSGASDIFVARYDPDGALIWARRGGGTGTDVGFAVAALSDDSVIVVGHFENTCTFGPGESNETTLTSAGQYDAFVARYGSDGTLAWTRQAGGAESARCNGVAALSDDSAVAAGVFKNSVTFAPGEPSEKTVAGDGVDAFIARYDSDGSFAWVRTATADNNVVARGAAALSDDSVVVTGTFRSIATFGASGPQLMSDSGDDIFVARYGANGSLAWARQARGDVWGEGVSEPGVLSDDSVVIAGYFYCDPIIFAPRQAGETHLSPAGWDDVFIARYKANGSLAWARRAGGSIIDEGHAVAVLHDDSIMVTGLFCDTATFGPGEANETSLTAADGRDIFVARYDSDGSVVWASKAGGLDDMEWGYGIAALPDNSVVVTGSFSGTAVFGPGETNETTLTSAGGQDIFIARYYP